jgi:hypothetical protein
MVLVHGTYIFAMKRRNARSSGPRTTNLPTCAILHFSIVVRHVNVRHVFLHAIVETLL